MAVARKYAPPSGFTEEIPPQAVPDDRLPIVPRANYGSGGVDDEGAPGQPLRVEIRGDAPTAPPPPSGFTEVVAPDVPAAAPEEPKPPLPETSAGGAAFRGVGDLALLSGRDELAAGAGAVGNKIGSALGLNDSTADFTDIYRQLWEQEQAKVAADEEQHPTARLLGQGAGLVVGAGLPIGKIAEGANMLNRIGRGAGIGSGYGAVGGALGSEPGQEVEGAATGAALGAGIGGALPPVAAGLGRVAAPIIERTGLGAVGNRAASGVNALARRAGQNVNELVERAARYRAQGFEPTLVDIMDESGRGVVRAAASRMTPARDAAQRFADQRRVDLSSDVSHVAKNISPNSRPVAEVISEVEKGRKFLADDQFAQVREDVIPLAPLRTTLATREGQQAIARAVGLEKDPALRKALGDVMKWARSPEAPPVPPELAALSPAAQAQAMAQMGIKAAEPPRFTAGMADKISRTLKDAAEVAGRQGANRRAGVLNSFGNEVRDLAKQHSAGYAKAVDNFAEQTTLRSGAEVGSRFMGSGADNFVDEAARLSNDPVKVPRMRQPEGKLEVTKVDRQGSDYDVEDLYDDLLDDVAATYARERGVTVDDVIEGMNIGNSRIAREMDSRMNAAMESANRMGGMENYALNYTLPDGRVVRGSLLRAKGRRDGTVTIDDISDWGTRSNSFGQGTMQDIAQELRRAIPDLDEVTGFRVTGSRAGDKASESDLGLARVKIAPRTRNGPSPRDLARIGARRSVEEKAGQGPRQALGVAEELAIGSNAARRTNALVGPETGDRLREGMGMAVDRVRNAQFIAPRTGSQTQGRDQDAEYVGQAINFVGNAMSGKLGMLRAVGQYLQKAGLRNVDAERLVSIAIDPARTDEAISYLVRRGSTPVQARAVVLGITRGSSELAGIEGAQ